MCSSESQEELPSSLSGPALGTRKRSVPSTFTFDDMLEGQEIEDMKGGGNKNISDSDDDFVVETKKKAKTSKGKKPKGLNKSASSFKSDGSTPSRSENSQVKIEIEVQLKQETSTNLKEYQCNQAVERPVTIATPEQINSRDFDQEEILTPNSCSNPMEEKATFSSSNIVKNLVEQVVQAQTSPVPVAPSHKTSEEMNMNALPPEPSSSQPTNTTPSHQPKVYNPQVAIGRGRGFRPANPLRPPSQARQSTPGIRPPFRPSGPRMLRPLRPNHPKNSTIGGPSRASQFIPRSGGPTGDYRQPNIRSATPIKRRSLSTPQHSIQYTPPVVELDDSPPRPDQDLDARLPPPTNSVVNKLTSLGVSVAMERVPTTKQGWDLPPGLSITRAPSTGTDNSPSTSLTSLANALLQLGEVQGRTRLVQYQLLESQIKALYQLGVREIGV